MTVSDFASSSGTRSDVDSASSQPPTPPPSADKPAAVSAKKPRIAGIDIARGLAIIGMIWAHTKAFSFEQTSIGDYLSTIPDGRSAALFALLAGVSLSLMTGRTQPYTGTKMYHAKLRIVGRAIMLLAIAGIFVFFPTPIAIILGYYAAWFILMIPVLGWSARRLFIAGAVLALVGPPLIQVIEAPAVDQHIMSAGNINNLFHDVLVTSMYPGLAYLGYVLIGMALGRLDLTRRDLQISMVVIGTGVALLAYTGSYAITRTCDDGFDGIIKEIPASEFPSSQLPDTELDGSTPGGSELPDAALPAPTDGTTDGLSGLDDALSGGELTPEQLEKLKKNGDVEIITPGKPGQGSSPALPGPDSFDPDSKGNDFPGKDFPDKDLPGDYFPKGDFPDDDYYPGDWSTINTCTLFNANPHSNTTPEVLGNTGVGVALLGLSLLLSRLARHVLFPVAAIGSMALTAYTAHVIILSLLPNSFGFYDGVNTTFLWLTGGLMVFCSLWKLLPIGRGPLE
ncbi:heparan-alpha-glucosaminide N-acetyltransferase domain-containing protein [Trueperella bialowiezensis]|uniref:Predicted membrane protein n=1 Tax=Trueperella bialowiezensis TaxID=312285 RepID=A0A3S4VAR0_9ACTO|nr:heparan-alpha-glucosaminide N-acetyltransferase domain-containing protein [Trueperella bialowiezensis]VEI13390.1 Predicted membrane protein [Trueperella bialowiezensis]